MGRGRIKSGQGVQGAARQVTARSGDEGSPDERRPVSWKIRDKQAGSIRTPSSRQDPANDPGDVSWVEVSRGSAFADVISPLPSVRRTRSKSSRWFGS